MKDKATIELTKEQATIVGETLISSEDTEIAMKARRGEVNIEVIRLLDAQFKE